MTEAANAKDNAIAAIRRRCIALEKWLDSHEAERLSAARHLDAGTAERAYWHHGYMMALSDVLRLLERRSLGKS